MCTTSAVELIHSAAMRRWLAVLLLVLLPLQFSWAAAANYCGHHSGAAADQFSPHDHVFHHHGDAVDTGVADLADGALTSESGVDSGHCHGYCVGMLDVPTLPLPMSVGSTPPSLHDTPSDEHVSAKPERPQWAPLA
ncbi:MAG: hypothetical protein MUD07_00505 [Burkholderiaceae bacterium]|nr:hypothetical protein [Burkholderiaceae bacterium]